MLLRSFSSRRLSSAVILFGMLVGGVPVSADEKVSFEKQILPIFESTCFKCHSAQAKKLKGEIRLDDVVAIREKSRTTNLIFPRKPEKSLLVEVISLPAGDEAVMPPADKGDPLSREQIALIRTWIEQGADFGGWKTAAPRPAAVAVANEPVNPTDVAAVARRIDELVESNLAKNSAAPNPPVADDLWCRRVHLDLIGRIPTYDEMQAFLSSRDPQKRRKLIDALLASPGHSSTMFNFWCDTLRARDRLAEDVDGRFYLHYLKENIRTNKPYDQWVRELISPDGGLASAPAVGYYLRDLGNRFASVDNTAIAFLGTQIGCAQCHDHPYDEWSRKAYHQFAAWTAAIETQRQEPAQMARLSEGSAGSVLAMLEKKAERRTTSPRRQLENSLALQIFEGMMQERPRDTLRMFTLRNGATANAALPADYQYPDAKPGAAISPAVLFGKAPEAVGRRPADTFAVWLTAPDNPRFALAIANRLWTRLFGAPFAGPVDNIRDAEDTANPELSRYLANVMVASRFDLRHFQRILASTRTYSRQAGALATSGAPYGFPGPLLRRMSAEQVWDSMMTLAVPNLDVGIRFDPPELPEPAPVVAMVSSDEVLNKVAAEAKERAAEQLKAARRYSRPKPAPKATEPMFDGGPMRRASELAQPTPESHFLRVFGQSNREVADAGWRSGTVPQTLLMLNSTLFDLVVARDTPLYRTLQSQSGDTGRLRAVYLAILGRVPTMHETRIISSTLHGTGNIEAIAHSLLNTRQFLFVQ